MEFDGTIYFLKQFEPLIYKTLHQFNIRPNDMDYDDYFQELQIKLISLLTIFKNDSGDLEEMNSKFVAYAGKGLYWCLLDLLRKKNESQLDAMDQHVLESLIDHGENETVFEESNLFVQDFFELAKNTLSEKDYQFFLQLADGKKNKQELADEYGVSRPTIYHWQEKLSRRLMMIKDCLLN